MKGMAPEAVEGADGADGNKPECESTFEPRLSVLTTE
jgi:hypothetical protein